MDKIWSTKPLTQREDTIKFDPNTLFPFKFEEHDLKQRYQQFKELKTKVEKQRKEIKDKEIQRESWEKQRLKVQLKETEKSRAERRNSIMRIRSMASNKIHRFKLSRSTESGDEVFRFTSVVDRTLSRVRNGTQNNLFK